jgi:two-component system LytT family sensor kinase
MIVPEKKIDIQKELEYLKNFIALEQVRKGEKIKVSVEQQGELSGFEIAPFMLIPFVENAFKHVSNFSSGKNIIGIEFKREADWFKAIIENTTDNLIKNEVGGIGLKNVRTKIGVVVSTENMNSQIVERRW